VFEDPSCEPLLSPSDHREELSMQPMYCVLVVDQDERVGDLVGRAFARRLDVVAVDPGLALDWLEMSEGASAMLLDLELPDTQSWELLRVVSDPDGFPTMPIIAMSSETPWDDFLYAKSIASDLQFLVKPFQLCELEECMYKALNV
jgi:DNA-binding response OmpR family regulator